MLPRENGKENFKRRKSDMKNLLMLYFEKKKKKRVQEKNILTNFYNSSLFEQRMLRGKKMHKIK